MQKRRRFILFLVLFVVLVILVALIWMRQSTEVPPAPDPYEGMVQVQNGFGGLMWIVPFEDLETADFQADDFYPDGEFVNYSGSEFEALRGIDVSEHQREIDWASVREDGVDFAIVRAGYRGYSAGTLNEDAFFRVNVEGALANGIQIGIYFFSQAVSTAEAREEARYLLNLIEGYQIDLPVFYDWEPVSGVGETRTQDVAENELTEFALAFCEEIDAAGYEAGVYFYRSLGYFEYRLDRLSEFVFWSAAPGEYPDFYYAHDFWQYSFTASVKGIEVDTDLNIRFVEIPNEKEVVE